MADNDLEIPFFFGLWQNVLGRKNNFYLDIERTVFILRYIHLTLCKDAIFDVS